MTNNRQNITYNHRTNKDRFNFVPSTFSRQINALSDLDQEPVRQIQNRLNRLGYGGLDNSLVSSIKQFQKDHGLKMDGIITLGGETLNKLNQLSRDPQNWRPIATPLPDTSGLSLHEELEGRFNGTLPTVRTDPQTGFRSAYYFGNEDQSPPFPFAQPTTSTLPQMQRKKDFDPKPHNYFQLPENCHNPEHILRMHLRRLNWGNEHTGSLPPDHTGYSMVTTCDDGRQVINLQDLKRTDDNRIIFKHSYAPAQNYLTDHGVVTWSTKIPEDMKAIYPYMIDYLNAKNVSHHNVVLGDEAARIYNLMGFENELINAVPDQQKPEYSALFNNCNTSTQWKKDNHFPLLKGDIEDIMDNGVVGEGWKFYRHINDHYQIVDAARNALLAHTPNIDFSEISNIHWSNIDRPQGEMLRFSDNQRNYIVDKNPDYPGTYQVMVRSRRR